MAEYFYTTNPPVGQREEHTTTGTCIRETVPLYSTTKSYYCKNGESVVLLGSASKKTLNNGQREYCNTTKYSNQTKEFYSNSLINQPSDSYILYYSKSYNTSSFINDVQHYCYKDSSKNLVNTGITGDSIPATNCTNNTHLPLRFNHNFSITIPKKVKVNIERHIPKGLLDKIHPEREAATEMCLWFISTVSTMCYFKNSENEREGTTNNNWVSLKAEYLRQRFSTSPMAYKKIIEALQHPLKTGSLIECDKKYEVGAKCFHYKLGDAYLGKGLVNYQFKNPTVKELFQKYQMDAYNRAISNPICSNLLKFYQSITLPTLEEIEVKACELVDNGYKTKKGKQLRFLNKHSKDYYKNSEEISFVEEAIDIFKYLTVDGLMVPRECNEYCGGRVVDTFTLMPSWIRDMVKFEGKRLLDVDYSCLHPNIAISLHGGKKEYLTHDCIANNLGVDIKMVKKEHLSFFNKEVWQMKESKLWDFYQENEPEMLDKIIYEKYNNNSYKKGERHKITSQRMFAKEVEIMTEVIEVLNKESIYVGYVYDALLTTEDKADRVKQIMDEVSKRQGVKTTAKISYK